MQFELMHFLFYIKQSDESTMLSLSQSGNIVEGQVKSPLQTAEQAIESPTTQLINNLGHVTQQSPVKVPTSPGQPEVELQTPQPLQSPQQFQKPQPDNEEASDDLTVEEELEGLKQVALKLLEKARGAPEKTVQFQRKVLDFVTSISQKLSEVPAANVDKSLEIQRILQEVTEALL